MTFGKPRGLGGTCVAQVLAGIVSLAFLPVLRAQTIWTPQASTTQQDLWGICPANQGSLMAVGTGGTILSSNDGQYWVPLQSGTTNWLLGVVFAEGAFVVVGDAGTILTSENYGSSWTQHTVGTARLNGVAFGDGLWLAVGEGGAVAWSRNGAVWTAGNAGVSGFLRGVAYRSDLNEFVVTGEGGVLLTTADGVAFQAVSSGTTSDIECAVFGGSPLLALAAGANGYFASAAVGPTWTPLVLASSTHFRGCMILGSTAIGVGSSGAIFSTDVVTGVSQANTVGTSSDLYAVANAVDQNGNTIAVAVGQGGVIVRGALGVPVLNGGITSSTFEPSLGNALTLSTSATGQAPLTYQWSLNGATISGATGPTLVLPQLQLGQNGTYAVTVTNALGSVTALFTVSAPYEPSIPGLVDEGFNPVIGPPQGTFYLTPDLATAAAVQADGKVIIDTPVLTRFNTDGTPDAAFAAASQYADIRGSGITAILVQPDGRIIVSTFDPGGLIGRGPSTWSARLNADGTPDASYTPDEVSAGVVETQDAVPQVILQDGRYLASNNGKIVRLTPAGAIDPTFSPTSPAGNYYALDPSGRVIVGGGPMVFRLNPDGTPDPTFAVFNAGFALTGGTVAGVFLQPGGKVVYIAMGQAVLAPYVAYVVGRLNADGSPDSSYAGLGIPSSSESPLVIGATTMTPDGSLWLDAHGDAFPAGQTLPVTNVIGHYHNGIIRIDPSGQLDFNYSLNVEGVNFAPGSPTVAAFPGPAALNGILQAAGGQWYVYGNFVSFNGEPRIGIARINPLVGGQFSKLGNISARGVAGSGSQTLIVGFVTQGEADMSMLLRGIGPGLAAFDVPGFLPDPHLELFDSSSVLQLSNNNWQDGGNGPAIAAADASVGAFALEDGSLDAAALATLSAGSHSFEVSQPGSGTGVALAEAYDANTSQPSYSGSRAINFSCRSTTGPGAGVLTVGFVIEGGNSKRVLIRAVGPSLAQFGVTGFLTDPVLTLFSSGFPIVIGTEAGSAVGADPNLPAIFTDVGAFSLTPNSSDVAMSPTLSPGAYTAQVTSLSGQSGVVLLEVYEVP